MIVAVLASCGESPFEPRGDGERIPLGRLIDDAMSGDSIRRYSFVAVPEAEYTISIEARQGIVQLTVVDSSRQQVVVMLGSASDPPQFAKRGATFATPEGGVQLLEVRSIPGDSAARFRFLVARRNLEPEFRAAAFSVGDTVAGETIESADDVDLFFTETTPGREIVAVMEAPGDSGGGFLNLYVTAEANGVPVAFLFAESGSPPYATTGRVTVPPSGRLWFRFWPQSSGLFRGAFRFWTYAIDRAPEHRAASVPLSTEIADEGLDRSGDVDEFVFTVAAGAEINAFFQASRRFQLEIAPQAGAPLASITDTSTADTSLFAESTGRIQFPQAGTYVARVSGYSLVSEAGPYRLYLYAIDRRPERAAQAITPGDTVAGESIDLPGDVDEFTFPAAAGQEFIAYLQARDGSPQTRLRLEAVDADGTVLRTATSVGNDSVLLQHASGRFVMRSTGTHRLRVSGVPDGSLDRSTGPYRLLLYRVNRAPESAPATLAFGDSVFGESVDAPGDADEFQVTVSDSSGANLVVQLTGGSAEGTALGAQLVDPATGQVLNATTPFGQGAGMTGRLSLGPGSYIVRVDGSLFRDPSYLRGSYRLWFYRFGLGPETVRDTIAVGDTVQGEALDPVGDADVFHFYGRKNAHVNVAIQGLAAPSSGAFMAFLPVFGLVATPTASAALANHQTMRIDLPFTGWYTMSVTGGSFPETADEHGAYRLALLPVATAPERVGAALALGDSVKAEQIDVPADVDQFTVTATPGRELMIIFGTGPSVPCCRYPHVIALDPATGDSLAGNIGQFMRVAGPARVPAGGQVTIEVFERPNAFFRTCYDATCGGIYSFTGPYSLQVVAFDRAPESAPQSYLLGDTVRTEALFPAGDIDEFTSSGIPGETLRPWYRLSADPIPANSFITLEIVDPATGAYLTGRGISQTRAAGFFSPGAFVVPPSGNYVVRIWAYSLFGDNVATVPYEFFVQRGP